MRVLIGLSLNMHVDVCMYTGMYIGAAKQSVEQLRSPSLETLT